MIETEHPVSIKSLRGGLLILTYGKALQLPTVLISCIMSGGNEGWQMENLLHRLFEYFRCSNQSSVDRTNMRYHYLWLRTIGNRH